MIEKSRNSLRTQRKNSKKYSMKNKRKLEDLSISSTSEVLAKRNKKCMGGIIKQKQFLKNCTQVKKSVSRQCMKNKTI